MKLESAVPLRKSSNQQTRMPSTWLARAVLVALAAGLLSCAGTPEDGPRQFSVVESSFADMQMAMQRGDSSSVSLVREYLARIERYEPTLNAAISINSLALARASILDAERSIGKLRGPLHGIPIALKDNIQTTAMPTTGGTLAFAGWMAPESATLARRLERAGAVILAKTTMTELANWVSADMPGGYNAVAGYSYNPYDPRPDPRPGLNDGRGIMATGGSSSGVGTAANLWAANIGTETSGSIQSPANNTRLVGIKPTLGRVSRHGIIPITADQDTAGPMAKTVRDAAVLLAIMEGEDALDPATGQCPALDMSALGNGLQADTLNGLRVGIPREHFYDHLTEAQQRLMRGAIDALQGLGAIIVDPVTLPSVARTETSANPQRLVSCHDATMARGGDTQCSVVLKYGMKRDFNAWLQGLGDAAPLGSLADLRRFNLAHAPVNAIRYGQERLDISDEMDVDADRARWQADRDRDMRLSRAEGLDAALEGQGVDVLLFPEGSNHRILNKAGYPAVIVPYSQWLPVYQPPLPDGVVPRPQPFGVSFVGAPCSEQQLIETAYAFEQLTRARRAPVLFP